MPTKRSAISSAFRRIGRGHQGEGTGARELLRQNTTTLANTVRDSMLTTLLDDSWNLPSVSSAAEVGAGVADGPIPEYFIDRSLACFRVLPDLLGRRELHSPAHVPERLLREALFYRLLGHMRTTRWGRLLDRSRMRLTCSVPGHNPGNGTVVRALLTAVATWPMACLPTSMTGLSTPTPALPRPPAPQEIGERSEKERKRKTERKRIHHLATIN
uniref:Uncharacterized protein n=1 Tax=Ananas comosus var. bracteatus TaxID=296719 RepID=A0A6V7QG73_ANACO|nr:unnamed protein product [Ananas comosus var. bracteatus]